MHHHYKDILDRIESPPLWWDEHAVPRFCEFGPDEVADIYADEVVLLRIHCQACGHPFRVAMSSSVMSRANWALMTTDSTAKQRWHTIRDYTLASSVFNDSIHYGDPPNYCCHAGATMNSIPILVSEFWTRHHLDWQRVEVLEREIDCDWKDN